jgi:hypothetical protein
MYACVAVVSVIGYSYINRYPTLKEDKVLSHLSIGSDLSYSANSKLSKLDRVDRNREVSGAFYTVPRTMH